jgi:hypothetical protein
MSNNNESARFSIRFNLKYETHQQAWAKLSHVPNGERSEYCIQSILGYESHEPDILNEIRKVIKESLQDMTFNLPQEPSLLSEPPSDTDDEIAISADVLNFMKGL